MMESGETIRTRKSRTVLVSAMVHVLLATVLILVPLLYTEQIQGATLTAFLVVPPPPPTAPPPPPAGAANAMPKPEVVNRSPVDPSILVAPIDIPREVAFIVDAASEGGNGTTGGVAGGVEGGVPGGAIGGIPGGDPNGKPPLGGLLPTVRPTVAAPPPPPPLPPSTSTTKLHEPIRIGGGVQAGNLLSHANPTYPQLARATRVEGSVVMQATIAEDGTIKDLKVITSSSPLLLTGVLDTVKTWRYKPTLLNNEPVEVITTITVNFSLGSR